MTVIPRLDRGIQKFRLEFDMFQYLSALYHAHPAINSLISLLIGSSITYFFTRIGDNRKIKIEKAEKTYNLLQELLFSLHDMHVLPEKYNLRSDFDTQLMEELEESVRNIESKTIYIDFLLTSYLKKYKEFYNACHLIQQYRNKRDELAKLACEAITSKVRNDAYIPTRKQFYKELNALKEKADEDIIHTMKNIKDDTGDLFLLNKINRFLLCKRKKIECNNSQLQQYNTP